MKTHKTSEEKQQKMIEEDKSAKGLRKSCRLLKQSRNVKKHYNQNQIYQNLIN
jgi:hypothetical protein